jgi:predicted small integral membrane protein
LWARPGAYPRVEHLKGPSLRLALALSANIRLGWKGLSGTNTLAYYENP